MRFKKLFKLSLHGVEVTLFWCVISMGWVLPFTWASAFCGLLSRTLGRVLPVNKIAFQNLSLAFPQMGYRQKKEIILGMWDNLGRTFMEYVRLPFQDPFSAQSLVTIEGLEHIDALIHDHKPGFILTAHLGNWDWATHVARQRGLALAQVTRFLNNPFMRYSVNYIHGRLGGELINKGSEGARRILTLFRQGHHVAMMADQKMNEGIAVPFFGHPAMTATAFAKIALSYQAPVVPAQTIRLPGGKAKVIYHPPLSPRAGLQGEEAVYDLLLQMNRHLEAWITQHPGQWFWVHKRWPKEVYQKEEA